MKTPTPLLQSLEELGAESKEFGLYSIKPFKDWVSSIWREKIFKMRLCNAGDLLDIFEQCQTTSPDAKIHAMRIEVLIRSIYSIDEHPLISPEELKKYNDDTNTNLSGYEFLRMWMKNLEQVVIERLDVIYSALQLKQLRGLRGEFQCGHCGSIHYSIPPNSKLTRYMACEFVEEECLTLINHSLYDFEPDVKKKDVSKEFNTSVQEILQDKDDYTCSICTKTFKTIEELNHHRLTCSSG